MKDINEYFAEKCDIETKTVAGAFGHNSKTIELWRGSEWSIQDPHCREIIRGRFKIQTVTFFDDKWSCSTPKAFYPVRESIAEAEIACLEAIYNAEKES